MYSSLEKQNKYENVTFALLVSCFLILLRFLEAGSPQLPRLALVLRSPGLSHLCTCHCAQLSCVILNQLCKCKTEPNSNMVLSLTVTEEVQSSGPQTIQVLQEHRPHPAPFSHSRDHVCVHVTWNSDRKHHAYPQVLWSAPSSLRVSDLYMEPEQTCICFNLRISSRTEPLSYPMYESHLQASKNVNNLLGTKIYTASS